MTVSPADAGSTSPRGSTKIATGSAFAISGSPTVGYYFDSWTVNGPATVADAGAISTTVVISGDATITAVFASEPPTADVTLTMAASPAEAGETYPAVGATTLRTGMAKDVTATATHGWKFMRWAISGMAVIDDPTAAAATATFSGDATITATFVKVAALKCMITIASTHKESIVKGVATPISKDGYTILLKTQLPANSPMPNGKEPVTLGLQLGDFSFLDTTDNATKRKWDATNGGYASFVNLDKTTRKAILSVQFRWNAKRQLEVSVKGSPTPDPDGGVANIVDLSTEKDSKSLVGKIADCNMTFGDTSYIQPNGKPITFTGKKATTPAALVGWNVKGQVK